MKFIKSNLIYVVMGFITLSTLQCNNAEKEKQIKTLKEENIELKRNKTEIEQKLYNLSEMVNFVQANLDTIKAKEQIISTTAQKNIENPDAQKRIKEDITSIYNKLIDNRRKLSKYQKQLSKEANKNKELNQIIERLNQQMDTKIIEIERLKLQLETMQGSIFNLNALIDTLKTISNQQQAIISYQQEELNTVYYAYGTKKELLKNNVISKEGGFLGIGKTKKIKSNLNQKYFTKANKFEFKKIPLAAKRIRIVTPHPENSYTIYGERPIDSLVINDPVKFWSNSQYLVLELK